MMNASLHVPLTGHREVNWYYSNYKAKPWRGA